MGSEGTIALHLNQQSRCPLTSHFALYSFPHMLISSSLLGILIKTPTKDSLFSNNICIFASRMIG